MPRTDEQLVTLLTAAGNPRTPLHFKLLDHQRPTGTSFGLQVCASTFHRSDGYACGITMGPKKPITKLFRADDGE